MQKARAFFFVCAGLLCLAVAYHLGATSAGAQAGAPEVATLIGTVGDGGTIPLPVYADGGAALESECSWIVSLRRVYQGTSGSFSTEVCSMDGRLVHCYGIVHEDDRYPWPLSGQKFAGEANYLIIAVRAGAPSPASQPTWGQLKAKYATPAPGKAAPGVRVTR